MRGASTGPDARVLWPCAAVLRRLRSGGNALVRSDGSMRAELDGGLRPRKAQTNGDTVAPIQAPLLRYGLAAMLGLILVVGCSMSAPTLAPTTGATLTPTPTPFPAPTATPTPTPAPTATTDPYANPPTDSYANPYIAGQGCAGGDL